MNIVLIGYRGTGKSALGKAIAQTTGKTYLSCDVRIVEKVGMTIPQIVEKHGWKHFRDIESEVAVEASSLKGHVIDTGGGMILREENVYNLKKAGKLILLTADLEKIVERIESDPNRPPLKEGMSFMDEQKKVLEEREPIYNSVADFKVDTSSESVEACVEKVVSYMSRF